MYKNYKIVVNTAAGRRRYMQYLIPYVVACDMVDRYDIWINTHNGADIEFFQQLATKFSKVNLVWQPDGVVNGNASINAFYKDCTEEDTIYFKLDDDVVWMEPSAIEKMVKFRVDNPQYFLVTPLVVNNSLATYLLQVDGKIVLDDYYQANASHQVLWRSGNFAQELHTWFIEKYLKTKRWASLHVGKKEMGMTRFSINAVLWFGSEMKKFGGLVPGDDEEFLSCIYPTRQGMSNAWNGDVIVAHFAFFTQRAALDKMGILEQYGAMNGAEWHENEQQAVIYDTIQQIMKDVQAREPELLGRPSPYRRVVLKKGWKQVVKKHIPESILAFRAYMNDRRDRSGYIVK